MPTLAWIIVSGVLMALIALIGGLGLLLGERRLRRLTPPLVALAAGSLLGSALFHMLPRGLKGEAGLVPWLWVAAGFASFFLLEALLRWRHCVGHRTHQAGPPVRYLILLGDGFHNLIGGLAVGAAFLADTGVGITVWLAAAAHEIPQELGDFGVLLHSGWSVRRALLWNFLSAGTFLLGGLVAYFLAPVAPVHLMLPFAAGSFLYIAAADLVPEVQQQEPGRRHLLHLGSFILGLALPLAAALLR